MQSAKLSNLEHDESWKCLKTEANLQELKDLFEVVRVAATEGFSLFFLNNDIGEVKKTYKDQLPQFYYKLQHMQKELEPPVRALDSFHSRLQRVYRASQA